MADSKTYLSKYQSFTKKRLKPEDYVKKYSKELGVDSIRGRVGTARSAIRSTEDVIDAIPEGVQGRTSGSLVTDAQRNRLTQNELAPQAALLSDQQEAFGDANTDLQGVMDQVNNRTQMAYQSDADKASSLLEMFNLANTREQQAEAKRQFEAQLAESRASRAQAAAAMANPTFGGGDKKSEKAYMAPKSNGSGYQFATPGGQAISAATYAKLTGQDIRDVLYTMGQSGDSYASAVYNQMRQDPFFGKGDKAYDKRVKQTYSPIFWGS